MTMVATDSSNSSSIRTYPVEPPVERCVLVAADFGLGEWGVDESLDELERLVETDGAIAVGRLVQHLDKPFPRTFLSLIHI